MISILRSTLKALLTALVTATVLIFIFAFIAFKTNDPQRLLGYFGPAVFFISCLTGGISMARANTGITGNIIYILIYIFLCLALSLVLGNKAAVSKLMLTYLGGIASAVLGGIMFSGGKKKRPKSLKRYKKQGKR